MGINKIVGVPKEMAIILNLNSPELYTGKAFGRSSATLLENCTESIMDLKRPRGWKSTTEETENAVTKNHV